MKIAAGGPQDGCIMGGTVGPQRCFVMHAVHACSAARCTTLGSRSGGERSSGVCAGALLWCPKCMVIYGKMVPCGFFPESRWSRPGKTSRGPLLVLDEDLIMGAVPISISASRTNSGVLETGKNFFKTPASCRIFILIFRDITYRKPDVILK